MAGYHISSRKSLMTLTFHVLWMLCALGAVAFAATAGLHVRAMAAMVVGLAVGAAWTSPGRLPDPVLVGSLTVIAAAVYLFRPRLRLATAAFGGVLAGVMTSLLEVQGVPAVLSPVLAAALLALPAWLAHTRPTFAPELLRDESMLIVSVVALGVAVLPGVLDGWQAATTLSAASERTPAAAVPTWTLGVLLTSSLLGACYSLWSRR
jgi:hypothetical protein